MPGIYASTDGLYVLEIAIQSDLKDVICQICEGSGRAASAGNQTR